MQQLLNTLYIQTDGLVLNLDSENVLIKKDKSLLQRIPLHHLGGITIIGRSILTSSLIAKCVEDGRHISYFDSIGRFQYRIEGPVSGNVLLRQAQHDVRRDQHKTEEAAKSFVIGKLMNTRTNILRMMRERKVEDEKLVASTKEMKRDITKLLSNEMNLDTIRGIEGMNARRYFASFGEWIRLEQRPVFSYTKRSRRPPLDRINALLSFSYRLMLNDVTAAVQGVGMDPQVGYLHELRPGRPALALDLLEELRPLCDRFCFSLINRKQLGEHDFQVQEGGAIYLNEKGRKLVIVAYQDHKQKEISHPILQQTLSLGVLPHIQARLFARYLRGDQVAYVPFTYK